MRKKVDMRKKIWLVILVVAIVGVIIWGKSYYDSAYVVSDIFYTQVPLDEINSESYMTDMNGNVLKDQPGKEYDLYGYNEDGVCRNVYFSAIGTSENYYKPGTYLLVEASERSCLTVKTVTKEQIPEKAFKQIEKNGTRIDQ